MPIPVVGGSISRTDMGVDVAGSPGAALIDPVPGTSQLVGRLANWFRGQPLYWFKVLSGPFTGKYWYAAEQVDVTVPQGGQVSEGQQIGRYASSGTATEWGWAVASGQTLAQATTGYTEGQVTPAGTDFLNTIIKAAGGSQVSPASGIARPGGSSPAAGAAAPAAGSGSGPSPQADQFMRQIWADYMSDLENVPTVSPGAPGSSSSSSSSPASSSPAPAGSSSTAGTSAGTAATPATVTLGGR